MTVSGRGKQGVLKRQHRIIDNIISRPYNLITGTYKEARQLILAYYVICNSNFSYTSFSNALLYNQCSI